MGPETARPISPAERAVLERLQERRQELDRRARELDVREGLLTAAEQRIEARLLEIKEIEARINATMAKKDEAEAARIKGLVTMYENMRAKEAARIFDRLDLKILVDIANQMNPRRLSDIVAQMSSETAGRLTVELAARSPPTPDLPKIEGRPGG
jgi:flagellar motility protein MotE (MotC chaperone)